jgi:hypothetical protein
LANVTIEYVILIPLLFTQVILFPMVASTMTSNWQNSQRDVELQDAANHLASTIQQLYLTVNRDEILEGTVTQASTIPVTVGSYPYTVNATLSPADGSSRVLMVTLTLDDIGNSASAVAVLGTNVDLDTDNSSFRSTSVDAYIEVTKAADGELTFSFGGAN